ncbi:MAG: kelch repeat-containing protein [Acidimicrobiales bacterium]
MATQTLKCERHGELTRLTCVECGTPICPKCAVRTEVGLKCENDAQPDVQTPDVVFGGASSRRPLFLGLAGLAVVIVLGIIVLASSGGGGGSSTPTTLAAVGTWTSAPDLAAIRGTTSAVVLKDGRVLVAGGSVGQIPLAATEIFDPAAGQWHPAGDLTAPRRGLAAVMLPDGRVLATGGRGEDGDPSAVADIFDPASGKWTATGPMTKGRLGHSLTALADGRVLAVGGTAIGLAPTGGTQSVRPDASAEIFDPATGAWTPVASMATPRFEHTATLMADGKVLIAGGQGTNGLLASTEIYDPAVSAFIRSNDMTEARTNQAAVRLNDRSVLVVGGTGGPNGDVSLATAEVFDPNRGAWVRVGPLTEARTGETATLLADGRVLVAGGESAVRGTRRSLASAELYEPGRNAWRSANSMACPRSEQAAVLLGDGSVLVVAGDAAFPGQNPDPKGCADRYHP